ncbi:NAD-dependent epimerase/dehydratase family protein [Anaerobacillus sp. CMMVII]|uniref:NAD(P)H-binding protein n=1 Tax=Anaerobacillus sp. CMMVII TaxID=2755588 RepID=UPI0021B6FFA8|nr:NAD(P)H-binding protein [Anaerobacillus sp. CMMVII]MCT8138187.1 NAD-dependent epimerase/dehydratase family protein [Anaerobacillus sp. CMMVII]
MKTALLIGATGLVGKELLHKLLECDQYEKVITVTRRPIEVVNDKLEQLVINFDDLDKCRKLFEVDTVFCTLGTTMKKAKTKRNFVKVDFDYPVNAAKLALDRGASQFFIVTAMGANQHSPFFYNQVKGNVEAAIEQLGFPTLYIIRPSLLIGHRNEGRFGEDVGQFITKALPFLFKGPLQKYQPNEARSVASAMLNLSLKEQTGTFIVESELIEEYK